MKKLRQLLHWLREKISLKTTNDLKRYSATGAYLLSFVFLLLLLSFIFSLYLDVRLYGWSDFRTITAVVVTVLFGVISFMQIRMIFYMKRQAKKLQERVRKLGEQAETLQFWMKQRGVEPPIWSPAIPEVGIIGVVCVRGRCPGNAIGEFWFNESGAIETQMYSREQKPSMSVN